MQFDRVLLSSCSKIRNDDELAGNFSSVIGEYFIPTENKTGFYKTNTSPNSTSDLRELLASILLNKINVPASDILLAYDDENNEKGCISMNILNEGEQFLEIFPYPYEEIPQNLKECNLENFIESDLYVHKLKYNFTPELLQERKNFLVKYVFISAFLGNDDIKTDNCQAIFNEKNGTIRNPQYYDMGKSFKEKNVNGQARNFFQNQTDMEVLQELYEKYPEKIQDISEKIETSLDRTFIQKVLENQVFKDFAPETRKEIWQDMGEKITYISRQNELVYNKLHTENSFIISLKEINELTEKTDITLVDKAKVFLHSLKQRVLGGNER